VPALFSMCRLLKSRAGFLAFFRVSRDKRTGLVSRFAALSVSFMVLFVCVIAPSEIGGEINSANIGSHPTELF